MRNTSHLSSDVTNHYANNSNGVNVMSNNAIESNICNITDSSHSCQSQALATKSCPKQSSRRQSIATRQTKRPPSERRFKCDQCERMFFTRKDVKRHLVVHTGIRNFACPYCTQRFGRKDHLVRHAKKSHNRDTRSSTAIRSSSQTYAHNKVMPTLIQPKNSPLLAQQMSTTTKHSSINYSNNQMVDHSTLVLVANNDCSNYGNHSSSNSTNLGLNGMSSSESLYVSGMQSSFDDMIASNTLKSESHAIAAHHYFAFPVNSSPNYSHTAFLPPCFVSNSNGINGINSCGGTTSMAAFGIPVPVCGDHSAANAMHTTISLDVNPSLPHFSQAFQ